MGELTVNSAAVTDDHSGVLSERDDIFLLIEITWMTPEGEESAANHSYFSVVDVNVEEVELDICCLEHDHPGGP